MACIMSVLHVINEQTLLTAGGVSGIALGFGAQNITKNLLAGITLVCDQQPESSTITNHCIMTPYYHPDSESHTKVFVRIQIKILWLLFNVLLMFK